MKENEKEQEQENVNRSGRGRGHSPSSSRSLLYANLQQTDLTEEEKESITIFETNRTTRVRIGDVIEHS